MGQIDSLALFPLADVVLLPEVAVPLYIFEPRYRQMTRDALDGAHQIGMVAVRPDSVAGMAGVCTMSSSPPGTRLIVGGRAHGVREAGAQSSLNRGRPPASGSFSVPRTPESPSGGVSIAGSASTACCSGCR